MRSSWPLAPTKHTCALFPPPTPAPHGTFTALHTAIKLCSHPSVLFSYTPTCFIKNTRGLIPLSHLLNTHSNYLLIFTRNTQRKLRQPAWYPTYPHVHGITSTLAPPNYLPNLQLSHHAHLHLYFAKLALFKTTPYTPYTLYLTISCILPHPPAT